MNLILTIVSLLFVSYLMISYFKRSRKDMLCRELLSVYDKMELNFIKSKKHLNKDEIDFLKTYKITAVNPDFLDIHILFISKIISKEEEIGNRKKWFDSIYNQQNDEFKSLAKDFDIVSTKIINLSIYNSHFIFFLLKVYLKGLLRKGRFSVTSFYERVKKDYQFIEKNENILIQQAM